MVKRLFDCPLYPVVFDTVKLSLHVKVLDNQPSPVSDAKVEPLFLAVLVKSQ